MAAATCAAVLSCSSLQSSPRREEVAYEPDEVEAFFDAMVDSQIEAGFEDPVIRADDPLLKRRVIVITGAINERTAKDTIARLLLLDRMSPREPIDLYISTQGGWLDTTFAVVDAMESIAAPVNTWAIGGVYSAGTLIVAAGTGHRRAAQNAVLMLHASFEGPPGDRGKTLDRQRFEAFWHRRARLPADWFPMADEEIHYLRPAEALDLGIIDEVVTTSRRGR